MSIQTQFKKVAASVALLGVLSGCGGTAYRQETAQNPNGGNTGGGTGGNTGGNTGGSHGPGDLGTDNGGDAVQNFEPYLTTQFTLTGDGGNSPTYETVAIDTDSIFKVRVTAGGAQRITVPGYNYSATYSCISYEVTVLGETRQTKLLSADGSDCSRYAQGAPAPSAGTPENSNTLDFSKRLTPGHNSVTVKVASARYDFYCQLWLNGMVYGTQSMYCPARVVHKNHTVSGTLEIQTNATN